MRGLASYRTASGRGNPEPRTAAPCLAACPGRLLLPDLPLGQVLAIVEKQRVSVFAPHVRPCSDVGQRDVMVMRGAFVPRLEETNLVVRALRQSTCERVA